MSALRSLSCCLVVSVLGVAPVTGQGWTTDDGSSIDVPSGGGASMLSLDDPGAILGLLLTEQVPAGGPAMAVAVMRDGELIYAGAAGMADLERNVAATEATVFETASIAKSVTAAAVAVLVEQGALDVDSKLRGHLPELDEVFEPVTLRHLLHHTAGVQDDTGLLALAGWRKGDPAHHEDALRVLLGQTHVSFEAGSLHRYSNGGYILLAEIVRRTTGQPLAAWAEEHLFTPLDLHSAHMASSRNEIVPGRAIPLAVEDGVDVQQPTSARHGAGGFLVSAVDLARWADELRAGRVLGRDVVMRMRRRGLLSDGTELDYAWGLGHARVRGNERWGHSGSDPGARSIFEFYPEHGLTIAAVSNSLDGPDPGQFATQVANLLLEPGEDETGGGPRMILITENEPAPAASAGITLDPAVLASYAGSYQMEDDFVLSVGTQGEQLLVGFDDEPNLRVFPLPSGRFILPPPNYELSFEPAHGRVTFHVTEDSQRNSEPHDVVGHRVRTEPLSAAEARELVGTYHSTELNAFYRVTWVDGALLLEHARHGDLPMQPLTPDSFTLPGRALARVDVRRDGERVIGLELQAYSWAATCFFERL